MGETEDYIEELQEELLKNQANAPLGNLSSGSMFGMRPDPNLIEFQLELDNILERIEHLLKGDILSTDNDGNVVYKQMENKDDKVFNDYGVQFLMNIMSFYLNRNTILSNYTEIRINQILYDFGYEITDQIWMNCEKMGMDTKEKRKRYTIIVMELTHTVESAYNRALGGGERESLRTARTVTQSADNYGGMRQSPMMPAQPKKSIFRPATWLK